MAQSRVPRPAESVIVEQVVLTRLSQEVERCVAAAAELQPLLGSILRRGASDDDARRAQSIDLLEQTLRDVQAMLSWLGEARGQVPADALAQRCRLDDVARRISGLPTVARHDDVEFF